MPHYSNPGPIRYQTTIRKGDDYDSWMYVEFPYDLKELFGVGNLIPAIIHFDAVKYRGSIAKMGPGHPMLLIRKDIRAELGKNPGDAVQVTVELDTKPRIIELDPEVQKAITAVPAAQERWEKLSFSHQREYAQWIEEAKKPETRQRRIEQTVERLAAENK